MAQKFDFKQFFLQHGERIGVGVAAALSVLLIVMSLFMPGHGVMSGSASEKASTLNVTSEWVEKRIMDTVNNKPTGDELPPQNAEKGLKDLKPVYVNAGEYSIAQLIPVDTSGTLGRALPACWRSRKGSRSLARSTFAAT